MEKFRFLTSGESHGKCLNAIIEGVPAGFRIKASVINEDLARRQVGYGRGGRMKIEKESEKFVNAISDEDKEKFLKLSYEEQLKAIDEYEKKYGFLEGA